MRSTWSYRKDSAWGRLNPTPCLYISAEPTNSLFSSGLSWVFRLVCPAGSDPCLELNLITNLSPLYTQPWPWDTLNPFSLQCLCLGVHVAENSLPQVFKRLAYSHFLGPSSNIVSSKSPSKSTHLSKRDSPGPLLSCHLVSFRAVIGICISLVYFFLYLLLSDSSIKILPSRQQRFVCLSQSVLLGSNSQQVLNKRLLNEWMLSSP